MRICEHPAAEYSKVGGDPGPCRVFTVEKLHALCRISDSVLERRRKTLAKR